jgi:hypothetical protein
MQTAWFLTLWFYQIAKRCDIATEQFQLCCFRYASATISLVSSARISAAMPLNSMSKMAPTVGIEANMS